MSDEIRELFANLRVFQERGRRAPHKPLLALWAIGRCLRNETRLATYDEVAKEMVGLLRQYAPPKKTVNPDLPFWHLRRDRVWEIPQESRITETKSGHAHITSLRREGAQGGLRDDVFKAFRQDRTLALDIVYSLLDAHFPATLHDDILRSVGIDVGFEHVRRRSRDSAFSRAVLDAYGEQCAVCRFSVRLHGTLLALDAAHIRWHKAGGPDRDKISNGLSLCALHHRLFDAGAFTLSPEYTVMTAPAARGPGRDHALEQFSHREILLPQKTGDYPARSSLDWHHREVFGPIE